MSDGYAASLPFAVDIDACFKITVSCASLVQLLATGRPQQVRSVQSLGWNDEAL